MCGLVSFHVGFAGELLFTPLDRTKPLRFNMSQHMLIVIPRLSKPLGTVGHLASKQLLACVKSHVSLHGPGMYKQAVAALESARNIFRLFGFPDFLAGFSVITILRFLV